MASDPCVDVCPPSGWRNSPVLSKGVLAAPACPNPTPSSDSGSDSGSSDSSAGSSGSADDQYVVVDVICSGGVLYEILARVHLAVVGTGIVPSYYDAVWRTAGCCDCGGSSGSDSGGGSDSGSGSDSGGSSPPLSCSVVAGTPTITFAITSDASCINGLSGSFTWDGSQWVSSNLNAGICGTSDVGGVLSCLGDVFQFNTWGCTTNATPFDVGSSTLTFVYTAPPGGCIPFPDGSTSTIVFTFP